MRRLLLLAVVLLPLTVAHAQGNPVTNGSFEALDAQGALVDWELLGKGEVINTARTGQQALLLDRTADAKGETGLNRRWKINSGEQGAMLAEMKGGLEFWYQAPAMGENTRMVVGIIPMSAAPVEGTGSGRVMYEVPRAHVGDKRWHRGLLKYDFTDNDKVKWLHVASRITGGEGQLILDDIQWIASVGPLPKVDQITLTEDKGKAGEACVVRARIRNVGDQPTAAGRLSIILPDTLKTPAGESFDLPATPPDGIAYQEWTVTGLRDRPDKIRIAITIGPDVVSEGRLDLAPKLVVEQLRADRFVVGPGTPSVLRLFIRNEGNVAVSGATARLLDTPAARECVAAREPHDLHLVRPGATVEASWIATPTKLTSSLRFAAEVVSGGEAVGQAAVELVCAPPQPVLLPSIPQQGAYAQVRAPYAVVGNQGMRLVFARAAAVPLGPGWLQVNREGKWRTVGVLPQLGSVATQPASQGEGRQLLQPTEVKAQSEGQEASLVITGKAPDGSAVTWALTSEPGADTIRYDLRLVAGKDSSLYGLHGPMLYVGEGSGGSKKAEAVLPGLEWLTPEEESSSTLDIAASMPQRWRWCPPPHAVTIPCMSISTDGTTVGLLWDQLQKITGEETRPRAIFAAPDRFEGRNACLLGLMAPGGADPEWWIPPRLATEKAWEIKRDQAVRLQCRLYAKTGAADALTAMDRWFALYGAPQPQRFPHGAGMNDEISFSAAGYLESLWDPKTQKWFGSLNGPNMMASLGWHPAYMYDLHYARVMAGDEGVKDACRERLALVEQLSGQKPVGDDMGFEFGNPVASLIGQADHIGGLMRAQGEDGSWRFHARIEKSGIFAGMDYAELGPDQAAEVGTCAQTAYTILRYARMTGDAQATAAGLKALQFMNRFTVPRAAQVWEVPVHTPDVLASADACEAYLEGYLITGDAALLKQAVFWARTGLPFIYMWDTPGYEALRYASIPVMGASWYTCNWFGRPVQWNGMRLARAYAKLDAYDQSYPWRQMAEGLTISTMWQQHGAQTGGDIWPDANEKWVGLWPDNFDSVTLRRCPWVFAPRQILDVLYRLYGMHPSPETVTLTQSGQTIRLNACAAISGAKWEGERLTATVGCRPPQTSQIVVCNIARPQSVKVDGEALPETPRLSNAPGLGWEYFPTCRALCIKPTEATQVPRAQAHWPSLELEIAGARFEQGRIAVELATKLDFGFDNDEQGWRAAHDLGNPVVREGVVHMTTTATDPYFVRGSLDVPADTVKTVVVRMALPAGAQGDLQVFWTTSDSPGFDEAKSARTKLIADGQMRDYAIPVGSHPLWAGKRLTGFRIDPGSGPAGVEVQIDAVRGM
ncbi:hypothetical protein LLH23_17460 [bacterium]|nr:hypothetical protein [bacterium]